MAEQPAFAIPTRQKGDLLFSVTKPPVSGSSIELDVRLIRGYSALAIFGVSDTPFDVRLKEGCRSDGSFPTTFTISTSTEGSFERACGRLLLCGVYGKLEVVFTAGVGSFLNLCGLGIPIT